MKTRTPDKIINRKKKEPEAGKKIRFSQKIFRDWCKSCGICVEFCPQNVFGRDEMGRPVIERPDDCIGCRFCEYHCPDFAIEITERGDKNGEEGGTLEKE
jgi:2-oxoglutarate ferredoxin oxidoreductase subunit delta